jgi:hypothetical protein
MRNFNDGKNNNSRSTRHFTKNNKSREENKNERIQELISIQEKNLNGIEIVVDYLDNIIDSADKNTKPSMKEIIDNLNNNGFNQADTKAISQINYILIDLANAQRNKYITPDRVDIRVNYIKERLITSYRRELYDRINEIFNNHSLFKSKDNGEEVN